MKSSPFLLAHLPKKSSFHPVPLVSGFTWEIIITEKGEEVSFDILIFLFTRWSYGWFDFLIDNDDTSIKVFLQRMLTEKINVETMGSFNNIRKCKLNNADIHGNQF